MELLRRSSINSCIKNKEKLNVELKQVPRGKSMIDIYHLQHINSIHNSDFKRNIHY